MSRACNQAQSACDLAEGSWRGVDDETQGACAQKRRRRRFFTLWPEDGIVLACRALASARGANRRRRPFKFQGLCSSCGGRGLRRRYGWPRLRGARLPPLVACTCLHSPASWRQRLDGLQCLTVVLRRPLSLAARQLYRSKPRMCAPCGLSSVLPFDSASAPPPFCPPPKDVSSTVCSQLYHQCTPRVFRSLRYRCDPSAAMAARGAVRWALWV